ncbi:MAG TPA: hypothetical protein VGQ06_12910 [Gemmatimonadales bacterium]|nr:hypothetical protein [Gemmatimonadales bacterium]
MKDPLAIGLGALAAGVGLGGATITLAQGIVAVLRERVDPQYYRFVGDDPLLTGLFAGVALAAFFGWRRSGPIDNLWQRGVIAVLSAVGALLVGFLAAVAHRLAGGAGLVAWGGASLALGMLGSRWATKGSGEQRAVSGS